MRVSTSIDRPRLLLAVAESVGTHDETFALRAAASIELLHAAETIRDLLDDPATPMPTT